MTGAALTRSCLGGVPHQVLDRDLPARGMGEKLFAIPFNAFKYDVKENEYVLDISKEKLQAAPGFDPEHWPSMTEEKWNRDVYKYYGHSPYWE